MAPALQLPPPTGGADDALQPSDTPFPSEGMIYPPPDLRSFVDKTAEFVARVGPAFEARIRDEERHNHKFSFLYSNDAYHAYYTAKVSECIERGGSSAAPTEADAAAALAAAPVAEAPTAPEAPPDAPPPHVFTLEFPGTPAVELEMLKLTALFTARKGQTFASRLAAREAHSHQFEFLKPTHPLFSYFNLLVEQYRRVMQPSTALLKQVRRGAGAGTNAGAATGPGVGGARMRVLPAVQKRAEYVKWDTHQQTEARHEEARRRAIFDEIDWQDFVVVGVVDITGGDLDAGLPPPRSLYELKNMVATQQRMANLVHEPPAEAPTAEAPPAETPAEGLPAEAQAAPPPPATTPAEAPAEATTRMSAHGPVKVRHDYVRTARAAPVQTTVCPVCGEQVAVNDMSEHVRIELLNPKFREERAKIERRKQEQASLAAGADPSHLLKQLAGARTDIFGVRADEEAAARREAHERQLARQKEKLVWDGHANSRTTAQDAAARTAELDRELAHMRSKPSVPAVPAGPYKPGKQPAPPPAAAPVAPAKRAAESEHVDAPATQIPRHAAGSDALLPETEWLAMHPNAITLCVRVPYAPHVAPQCDGRLVEVSALPLSATIGHVRDRVLTEALGRAVGGSKLKLWVHGKPATLRQTLAYWNMRDNDEVEMSMAK